jgi:hypothetical protein
MQFLADDGTFGFLEGGDIVLEHVESSQKTVLVESSNVKLVRIIYFSAPERNLDPTSRKMATN